MSKLFYVCFDYEEEKKSTRCFAENIKHAAEEFVRSHEINNRSYPVAVDGKSVTVIVKSEMGEREVFVVQGSMQPVYTAKVSGR